jgi:hypothetical protein
MKRTTNNAARKAQLAVVRHDDHNGLLAHFAQSPELFAPMLNLIANGKLRFPLFFAFQAVALMPPDWLGSDRRSSAA